MKKANNSASSLISVIMCIHCNYFNRTILFQIADKNSSMQKGHKAYHDGRVEN